MGPRERIQLAINHQEPDRVPLDLGATSVTGVSASALHGLRVALGLSGPEDPVKVVEPYQMLGEIAPDLMDALSIDVVGLSSPRTMFGFENLGWKEWTTFDGTPVLVPEGFNTTPEPSGDLLMYPEGDTSAPPSGRMPSGGWYFDSIVRQPAIDDAALDVEDNLEEFGPISDADIAYYAEQSERLFTQTDKAILANFGGTAFGDIDRPLLAGWYGSLGGSRWHVVCEYRLDSHGRGGRQKTRQTNNGRCESDRSTYRK